MSLTRRRGVAVRSVAPFQFVVAICALVAAFAAGITSSYAQEATAQAREPAGPVLVAKLKKKNEMGAPAAPAPSSEAAPVAEAAPPAEPASTEADPTASEPGPAQAPGTVASVPAEAGGTPAQAPATTGPASASATPGEKFRVAGTDGGALRLRQAPSLAAPIISRLPEGTIITLSDGVATESDGERWLPIKTAQGNGWVAARYLTRVVAQQQPVMKTLGPNAGFGGQVATLATSLVGQRYVFGGNKPGGFDCSGFAQWVFSQAGLAMPRLIPDQLALGKKVEPNTLQVGDLVAFVNTYTRGLSHVGIYLGDNLFVHAADEARGVTVSSLEDTYWKSRFSQAVRLR